ncbi:hypothetical protein [Undibacterium sp. Di24W]|uniref:hypothetical protein n=1 Tax=Undibacterium sp. Di24W TaxID=3413033 RepID=UPI003BEF5568
MKSHVIAASLVTLLSLNLPISNCIAAQDDVAILFVTRQGLGNNLSSIGTATAFRTVTYATIAKELGEVKARELIKIEIDRLLPVYQKRWNRNLALSYSEFLTPEELTSVATEGKSSKYFSKFQSKQAEVGTSMQAKSTSVLTEFVSEVLKSAQAKAFAK